MENTPIIQTAITTEIRMALNIEPISPMIVDITLSECTIATTVEEHLQGNILIIFATLRVAKMIFLYFFICNVLSCASFVVIHGIEIL